MCNLDKIALFDIIFIGGVKMKYKPITEMERAWAKQKYSVLAKSQLIYNQIRELLKDKVTDNRETFYQLIEDALSLEDHLGQMANAYHHVFGYVKKVASLDEKVLFIHLIDSFLVGKFSKDEMLDFLYDLAKRADAKYILNSTFF